jgi:hypothetical protein
MQQIIPFQALKEEFQEEFNKRDPRNLIWAKDREVLANEFNIINYFN